MWPRHTITDEGIIGDMEQLAEQHSKTSVSANIQNRPGRTEALGTAARA